MQYVIRCRTKGIYVYENFPDAVNEIEYIYIFLEQGRFNHVRGIWKIILK